MSPELTDTSLPSLARAVEESRHEMVRNYGRSPVGEVYECPQYTRVYTGVPEPFFNGMLHAHLTPEEFDGALDAALAYFGPKGIRWSWVVGPATEPADIGPRLEARGFSGAHVGIGMAADLQAPDEGVPPPEGLEIVLVSDREMLATFVATYVAGFGMSPAVRAPMTRIEQSIACGPGHPYRRFLGFLNGQPVGTTATMLGERVAGVYHVGCVPAARRQGVGTAMVRRALAEARAEGYRIATLHASQAGARIYSTLGFRPCTELREYILEAAEGAARRP